MRFRSTIGVAVLALCTATSAASPEATRKELTARLQRQLQLSPAELARGPQSPDSTTPSIAPEQAAALEDAGKRLWERKFRNGRTLAGCFPNGGLRVAAAYPQYDPRLKQVVTLEMAINQCLKTHKEPLLDPADGATMGLITLHLRKLAANQKLNVRVPASAEVRFEQGRRLYFSRLGQRNYACASCHVQAAGKVFDEQVLTPVVGQAARYPAVTGGGVLTLQARMRQCLELMGAAPFPAGSAELNELEYFIGYLSNGLTLSAASRPPK